ncbi:hypothetical protein MTO96_050518 [Rhipicephalus appendiculatus]
MYLGAVNQPADAQRDSRLVEVDLNGYSLIAKIDPGAQVSVVPATFAGIPEHLQPARETLSGPSVRALQVVGKFDAATTSGSRRSNQVVYVVQRLKHPLLRFPAIESLGLVKFLYATERVEERHPELFNSLGLLPGALMGLQTSAFDPVKKAQREDEVCQRLLCFCLNSPRSYWVQTERGHVRRNRKMLVPLPASQKKAQPPPCSLLFDSDDDFEPSPVAGPQAALYNGAPSQRGDSLRTDSNNSLPTTVNDAPAETSRVPATTTRSGRRVFVPDRYGVVT